MTAAAGSLRGVLGLFACAVAWLSTGCAGGIPLLHPAQVLDQGQVRASGGFSANVAVGGLSDSLRDANQEAAASGGAVADEGYARGALSAALAAPGIAPVVSARVGLGHRFEAGISYTGRGARLDARRAFDLAPHWALSLGAGGSAVFYGRQSGDALPGVDLTQAHGWGADVPLLLGYASDGGLYMVWIGARAGGEQVDVGAVSSIPTSSSVSLSATHLWGGGLLGLAAGFRHVHVALELDASYAHVSGDYLGVHASVDGAVLTPAGALWWDF